VFDQRVALAGAQPREVFLQVLEKAMETAHDTDTAPEANQCDVNGQCDPASEQPK
jgi:hypothetical protein